MAKVETKVTAASVGALAAGVVLAVITAFLGEPDAFGALPDPVVFLLVAALPPVATFLSGYAAPHTSRPEVGE